MSKKQRNLRGGRGKGKEGKVYHNDGQCQLILKKITEDISLRHQIVEVFGDKVFDSNNGWAGGFCCELIVFNLGAVFNIRPEKGVLQGSNNLVWLAVNIQAQIESEKVE